MFCGITSQKNNCIKKKKKEQQAVTLQTKVQHPSFGPSLLVAWRMQERPHREVHHRSRSEYIDERARASPWLIAAILRLTGNENAQILTASPHDAPPISTRRCCQSERRRQRRRELVMFSLYGLFLFFGAVYWIPPEFITSPSLPPAFKTIILQPPGSSYQGQPDGEAARLAASPDLLIERDGRHCRASLRFASLLLHLVSPTPRVIATSLINRLLESLAVGVYVSFGSAWKIKDWI